MRPCWVLTPEGINVDPGQSGGISGRGQAWIYFFAALGGLLFGYDTGVIGGAILFIRDEFRLSSGAQGLVVSLLLLGAIVGSALAGPLNDRYGRRKLLLWAGITFTVGALGAALAPGVGTLYLFRFVLGLAVGAAAVSVPLYLSESAPTRIRGAVATLNQVFISIGFLLAYGADLWLSGWAAWRWMVGLAVIPGVLLAVGIAFQSESPRWLVRHNRLDEARAVLARSRDPEAIDAELAEIQGVERASRSEATFRELMRARWVRPALVAACGLTILQQFIGINTIAYYAPTFLSKAGLGDQAAILNSVGLSTLGLIVCVGSLFLVDRVGRKPLLLTGLVLMGVAMGVLGINILVNGFTPGPTVVVDIACLWLYSTAFSISWGPVVWVMVPEVFPLRFRGAAAGIATLCNWAANFVVSAAFPVLLGVVGWVYVVFAVICFLSIAFTVYLVPETRRRSLEQIEEDLRARIPFAGRVTRQTG